MWCMIWNLYVFQFVTVFLPNMSLVLYVNIWFGSWYQWIGEGGLQSKNRAGPGKPEQVRMEVNVSECPHSLLVKTRDSCWDKGQELSKGSGRKEHKRAQAVTWGWSLSFGSWITKDKSESDTEGKRAPLMLANRTRGVPSVLKTDLSGTCYSMVWFKEKWVCIPAHTLAVGITPVLCHLLLLRPG